MKPSIVNRMYERFLPSPPNQLPTEITPPPTRGVVLADPRFITHTASRQRMPASYAEPINKLGKGTNYRANVEARSITVPIITRRKRHPFRDALAKARNKC